MESNDDIFTIAVTVNGKSRQIHVITAETTDGIAYYKCNVDATEITQVRKDDGAWQQLWGNLNQQEIESIGDAIDAYHEKNTITS